MTVLALSLTARKGGVQSGSSRIIENSVHRQVSFGNNRSVGRNLLARLRWKKLVNCCEGIWSRNLKLLDLLLSVQDAEVREPLRSQHLRPIIAQGPSLS